MTIINSKIKINGTTGYLIVFIGACLSFSQSLWAQAPRTGTHIKSNALPSYVMQINEPDEVERIRRLVSEGKKEQALTEAERYVREMERATPVGDGEVRKYYAYNAYCTVLTSVGRVDEAIDACSRAMILAPSKWSAVNNRGTAKFVAGQLQAALADYEQALTMVEAENQGVIDTIRHNITLVQERLR